jgi:hypothetical protein
MGEFVLNNVQIFLGQFDFSGTGNSLEMNYGAELVDVTAFNDGARSRLPGFESFDAVLQGFLNDDAKNVDEEIEARHAGAAEAMSVSFGTGAVGDQSYLSSSIIGTYEYGGGDVGSAGTYSIDISNQGTGAKLVQGFVLGSGQYTSTTSTAEVDVGNLDVTTLNQTLYSAAHVVSWDGTTTSADIIVESDETGFGSPTTRITHPQFTDVGSSFLTYNAADISGSETFYRITITLAGASPDVTIFVTVGIK